MRLFSLACLTGLGLSQRSSSAQGSGDSYQPMCGCFIDFDNKTFPGFHNSAPIKQILLPAVAIDAQVKVSANLASTKLAFSYQNPSDRDININFKFPTDVNTAIYRVTVKYENGDQFEAKIQEKEKARKIYEEAKKTGQKAALVETDSSQDDILLINLANIPANESATVEITTSQILKLSNGYLKYKLATSLFSRYNPSAKNGVQLREKLASTFPKFADRFNHIVKPEFTFNMEFDDVNNLDFSNMDDIIYQEDLLTKTAEQITQYNTLNVFKKDNDVEVMFKSKYDQKTFVTKETVNGNTFTIFSHFIETSEFDSEIENSNVKPLEYILVVDNSGSMGTDRMEQAKDACKQIINSLPQGSGFNVVKFGSSFDRKFESSVGYTNENKKAALEYIGAMDSDLGGTEILTAMKVAMCEDEECVGNLKADKTDNNRDRIINYLDKNEVSESTSNIINVGNETYEHNQNLGWTLKPKIHHSLCKMDEGNCPPANRITIKLSPYEIEPTTKCAYDALTIRVIKNGVDIEEKREIICGSGEAKTIILEDFDEVKVGFYSDGSDNGKGVSLTWSSEYDPSIKSIPTIIKPESLYHPIKQLFVITDGDVSNAQQIFDYVNTQTDKMRVFGVGIGAGASSSLVNGISERGNGFASFVSEKENAFYEVESLAQVVVNGIIAASKGYITNVQLDGRNYPAFVDTAITTGTFVHIMTDMESGSEVSVLNYSFKSVDNVVGSMKSVNIDHHSIARDSGLHSGGLVAIMAKKELQEMQKEKEVLEYDERQAKTESMIELSVASNVLCPKTAFVGVVFDKNGVKKNGTAIDFSLSIENTEDCPNCGVHSGKRLRGGGPQLKSMNFRMMSSSLQSRPVAMRKLSRRPMSRISNFSAQSSRSNSSFRSMAVGLPGPQSVNTVMSPVMASATAPTPAPTPPPTPPQTPPPTTPPMPMYEYDMQDELITEQVTTIAMFSESLDSLNIQTTTATPTTTTTTTTTTTIPTTTGPLELSTYLDLTNLQEVDGKWSLMSVKDFIATDHLTSLQQISGTPDDIATVSVIVMLQKHFGNEKQDWSASADKAWDATTFKSRMAARSLVRQVISLFGYNLSVFDVVA